jgi:hydroxymethylglutaryl-CoA lyase
MKREIKKQVAKFVKIVEVGPRDGLQNEKKLITLDTKLELISKLSKTGVQVIEAGSFVSPKWVPQMKDTTQIYEFLKNKHNLHYPALCPNLQGLDKAIELGVKEIAIFGAASEMFSQKNINCSIKESLQKFELVAKKAHDNNIKVRGYVSTVVGCPYQGIIHYLFN